METKKQAVLLKVRGEVIVLHRNFSKQEFEELLFSGESTKIEKVVEFFFPKEVVFSTFYGTSPVKFFQGDAVIFKAEQYGLAQQLLNRIFGL